MATLPVEDQQKIQAGLSRFWSSLLDTVNISHSDLLLAVQATDQWIDDNQANFNSALPPSVQAGLSTAQKTLLFCAVAVARVSIAFARRLFDLGD